MRAFLIIVGSIVVLGAFIFISSILGYGCFQMDQAQKVAYQQTSLVEIQRKYEWFKDAAAQLDKKRADIQVFQANANELASIGRGKMDRSDKEELFQLKEEVAGMKASYNLLAADYNAQMAKWNWKFANRGSLPAGASDPLPREIKPYATQ